MVRKAAQMTPPDATILRNNVPGELRAKPQWMAWRKGETKPDGRFDKPPVSLLHGYDGSTNNPGDWGTFEEAVAFARRHGLPGVEFVFTEDDPLLRRRSGPLPEPRGWCHTGVGVGDHKGARFLRRGLPLRHRGEDLLARLRAPFLEYRARRDLRLQATLHRDRREA